MGRKTSFLLSLLLLQGVYAQEYAVYPDLSHYKKEDVAHVKRGEYLVKTGDCIACHTPPGAKPFSGGLPMKTPFGTFYSPNITGDKEFGIGRWSEREFFHALHDGLRPDDQAYFPVFPYIYFNQITERDAADIFAYLQAIPKVAKKNKKMDVPWPFSWRFGQVFWRLLFFDRDDGPYRYDTKHSKAWNRGAYLVKGLGHCNMCHGPINLLGAPKKNLAFTGSDVSGAYAPNITGGNLKHVTIDKIIRVFLNDELLSGGKVSGPMREVNHDSLGRLKTKDLRAIALYLRTLKDPQDLSMGHHTGREIYTKYCSGCHATGAGGAPKFGDTADWGPLVKSKGKKQLYYNAIHGFKAMPAKGTCLGCTNADVDHAVDYMVDHSLTGGNSLSRPRGKPVKLLTIVDGKRIYQRSCASCHAKGGKAPAMGNRPAWAKIAKQNVDVIFTRILAGAHDHPVRAGCVQCTEAEVLAAIKYLLNSNTSGNYKLW